MFVIVFVCGLRFECVFCVRVCVCDCVCAFCVLRLCVFVCLFGSVVFVVCLSGLRSLLFFVMGCW